MIISKEDYIFYLEADRIALKIGKKKPPLITFDERYQIWKFQRLLRKVEYLKNVKSKASISFLFYLFHRVRYNKFRVKYGFSIPLNVFGPGLAIMHIGTIVVNGQCKVGENCRIHVCVNIGEVAGDAPKLGNNIYIGPGAKLYGGIQIADHVVIGANAVVNKTFTQNSITIAGVPAKIISNKGSEKLLIDATGLLRAKK